MDRSLLNKLLGRKIFTYCLLFSLAIAVACGQLDSAGKLASLNPEAESAIKPIKVAVISDLNSQYGSTVYEPEIAKAINLITTQWHPDLVLGGGDAIAGQKTSLSDANVRAMWQTFDTEVAKPLREAQIPYAFTIGNHDGSGAVSNGEYKFQRDRDFASQYWNDPQHLPKLNFVDKANFPFYYSFEQNQIFYLVWDASTHKLDPKQLAWVEQTLNSKPAQQAQMQIAIGHLPLYPVAETKNKLGEYLAEGSQLQALLEKYQVHTYISGHHHAYYPGKKASLELLYAGALGQGARKLIGSDLPGQNTITMMEIDPQTALTSYQTYDIKTLDLIDEQKLPTQIVSEPGLIWRRDITNASKA